MSLAITASVPLLAISFMIRYSTRCGSRSRVQYVAGPFGAHRAQKRTVPSRLPSCTRNEVRAGRASTTSPQLSHACRSWSSGSAVACLAHAVQIGCVTTSSVPQVRAVPSVLPDGASQNAHPERVRCILTAPRRRPEQPSSRDGTVRAAKSIRMVSLRGRGRGPGALQPG